MKKIFNVAEVVSKPELKLVADPPTTDVVMYSVSSINTTISLDDSFLPFGKCI